jgi:hypothetical protein
MEYAIIDTSQYNGISNNGVIFIAQIIYNGIYKDKYALPKNNISAFPELFQTLPYEIHELDEINLINTYPSQPEIDQYRLIDVVDLYNETININLFDNLTLGTLQINRPYINGTWTNEDIIFYVNQLNEEARLK